MSKFGRFAVACAAVVCGFGAEAAESSKVVTGGLRVTEWTVDAKGWWHAKLPVGTRSSHFFVNGQRRTRPTLPRHGWFNMDDNPAGSPERQRFAVLAGQVPDDFDVRGVEACVVHWWTMSRLPVVDYAGRTVPRKLTKDLPPVPAVFDAACGV